MKALKLFLEKLAAKGRPGMSQISKRDLAAERAHYAAREAKMLGRETPEQDEMLSELFRWKMLNQGIKPKRGGDDYSDYVDWLWKRS